MPGFALIAPGLPTLWAAVAVILLFLALWAVSVRLTDAGVVDPFWGMSFVLVALVTVLTRGRSDGSLGWVLLGMSAVWGLRLGGFLLARFLRHSSEDPRYQKIREQHEGYFTLWSLPAIFGTQALLVLVVSLPIQVAGHTAASLGAAAIPGLVVWAVGTAFEAVADEQRRRFSAAHHDDDAVLDSGLWHYSRHPNKFGDALAWWGIWLVALTAGGTWWTVIGPLVMTAILVKGTAAGEEAEGDSAQARYARRTSDFVPLPTR